MRNIFLFILLLGLQFQVGAQRSLLETVQEQLDAYNKQDIDRFVAVFHAQAEIFFNLGDVKPSAVGSEKIREIYGNLFSKHPENRSILKGRMVQGNFVIDHEYITGRDKPIEMVAIYEVKEGLIVRCWFLR